MQWWTGWHLTSAFFEDLVQLSKEPFTAHPQVTLIPPMTALHYQLQHLLLLVPLST